MILLLPWLPFLAAFAILFVPKQNEAALKFLAIGSSTVCFAITLFLFVTFVTALPIGLYFLHHPQDFFNRAGEISVFADPSPLRALGISAAKTLGMFFWNGDCNWRHNFACQPELHPLVALLFAGGILLGIRTLFFQNTRYKIQYTILFVWFFSMMLPVVLTREGIPHALRAIGMIPPVMMLAALGAQEARTWIYTWAVRQKNRFPDYAIQLERIRRELINLACCVRLAPCPLIRPKRPKNGYSRSDALCQQQTFSSIVIVWRKKQLIRKRLRIRA